MPAETLACAEVVPAAASSPDLPLKITIGGSIMKSHEVAGICHQTTIVGWCGWSVSEDDEARCFVVETEMRGP
jgi:hypothetical protein